MKEIVEIVLLSVLLICLLLLGLWASTTIAHQEQEIRQLRQQCGQEQK